MLRYRMTGLSPNWGARRWGAGAAGDEGPRSSDGIVARRVDAGLLKPGGGSRQGSMNRYRKIISICGFSAAIALVVPAVAPASSLLSGYGGPGQGNQAILGAALLNGPRGGGGSGGGSGGVTEGASESSAESTSPGASGETGQSSGTQPAAGGSGNGTAGGADGQDAATRRAARKGARAGTSRRPALAPSYYPAAERIPVGEQSSTLGFSGADLIYIILGAGTLAFVGVFTRRMTRTDAPGRHR